MSGSFFSPITAFFPISDEQAMWRVQNGDDAQAFAQLMNRWEKPIQNLCTRMTGDAHRAEDLTQEAFARVYGRRKEYKPEGRFSTYLWRIALNLCYDEIRRKQRRKEFSLDDPDYDSRAAVEDTATDSQPSRILEARERVAEVKDALLQLPEAHRVVLVLRHYENLKFREIAEVLSVPEGTVKSRMAEALNSMGRILHRAARSAAGTGSAPRKSPDRCERVFRALVPNEGVSKGCL